MNWAPKPSQASSDATGATGTELRAALQSKGARVQGERSTSRPAGPSRDHFCEPVALMSSPQRVWCRTCQTGEAELVVWGGWRERLYAKTELDCGGVQ